MNTYKLRMVWFSERQSSTISERSLGVQTWQSDLCFSIGLGDGIGRTCPPNVSRAIWWRGVWASTQPKNCPKHDKSEQKQPLSKASLRCKIPNINKYWVDEWRPYRWRTLWVVALSRELYYHPRTVLKFLDKLSEWLSKWLSEWVSERHDYRSTNTSPFPNQASDVLGTRQIFTNPNPRRILRHLTPKIQSKKMKFAIVFIWRTLATQTGMAENESVWDRIFTQDKLRKAPPVSRDQTTQMECSGGLIVLMNWQQMTKSADHQVKWLITKLLSQLQSVNSLTTLITMTKLLHVMVTMMQVMIVFIMKNSCNNWFTPK